MKIQEAAAIVAEFMGWYANNGSGNWEFFKKLEYGTVDIGRCLSLDTLEPVWENLGSYNIEFNKLTMDSEWECILKTRVNNKPVFNDRYEISEKEIPIQEAALIATANAIKEVG